MSHKRDDELQKEIRDAIEHIDDETLRAIYAYLAPVELSLSPEQDATLREHTEIPAFGKPQFFSWPEIKAAIGNLSGRPVQ